MLLEVSGVRHDFGGPEVLRGVDLSLQSGDGFALLGPNGAGKSTLIRLLAGLARPRRGEIRLIGRSVRESRARIGLVAHESMVYEGLSAAENLALTARLYGLDRVEQRVRQGLEEIRLDWTGEKPVGDFSRGMTQRLSLARALLPEPRLLLLDEPFSGLDPDGVRILSDLLVRRREAGVTIFLTTHDLPHLARVANQIGWLEKGKVRLSDLDPGRPDQVHEAYCEIFAGADRTRSRESRR